ncbi:MAG TPA: sugar phosphate isomerase/epimerase family protein [Bryobacteraceae bacterium]|nr:sugar phosphate isomerase/epimerase family protein [Bryobacteraceae bacterium]
MLRRTFIQSALAAAALPASGSTSLASESSAPASGLGRLPIAMAVEYNMLTSHASMAQVSIAERFRIARAAGFARIECPTTRNEADAEAMKKASHESGLPIHSVMNMDHWKYPFSSADPSVVEKSLEGARVSIRNAHLWGADTVLLVPGVVDAHTSYRDAYTRSQAALRKLIPLAEELNVTLCLEEVWNKFLLSPLEFARYVDEFESPRVRAYFDVGNVVLYGYPQDWIRILGKRIAKLHIKDFAFRRDAGTKKLVASWVALGDGDIDWNSIYDALKETGYQGTATVELEGGDSADLKEICRRFGLILSRGLTAAG